MVTPMRTEIIINAIRTQNVLGEKGRRIRELTYVVQNRFKFSENSFELYAKKVNNRGLCVIAQAESLRYKLLEGLAIRRNLSGTMDKCKMVFETKSSWKMLTLVASFVVLFLIVYYLTRAVLSDVGGQQKINWDFDICCHGSAITLDAISGES